MKPSLAPHRCFCGEVTKEQQRRGKLRVMGTLVSIVPLTVPWVEQQQDEDGPYTQRFILDDGTNEMAQFLASDHMTKAVQIGMTIDCIVHVLHTHNQQQQQNPDDQETATSTLLVIHTLIIMPDGGQALSLRNMEILYQRQGRSPGHTIWNGTDATKSTPSLTWHDINNIIQAEAEIGVRLEDLQEMFVVEKDELQEIIQELQMQGCIEEAE
eukprot:scaffold1793_cov173-Amphora_coffeaeformis.AAC.10